MLDRQFGQFAKTMMVVKEKKICLRFGTREN